MSPERQRFILTIEQEPFLCVRSLAAGFASGHVIEEHTHHWHQLIYGIAGAMTVYAARFSWMIPPGRAVFLPAGCGHSIRMWGEVAMRTLYFPVTLALPVRDCRVVSVTPLLKELILRVVEITALDSRVAEHKRLLGVLIDEIGAAPETPLRIPLPADPRALSVARHVLATPSAGDTLDQLARLYGASRRTLERLFLGETGMSFGMWRQKVRLVDSIRLLAQGKPVTDAAFDSGYSSVSAYVAAFKRTFGCTPGRFELLC